MDESKREELEKTHKKEKNPRVSARLPAVHTVYVCEKSMAGYLLVWSAADGWPCAACLGCDSKPKKSLDTRRAIANRAKTCLDPDSIVKIH